MKGIRRPEAFHPFLPVAIAGLVLLAAALRLYGIGGRPLWLDEALTWLYAGQGYSEFASRDVHPPLYYSLVRLWMHGIPGLGIAPLATRDNEFFLRLPSALFSVLTVPLVAAIGCRIGGLGAGLIAALLFTLSPFQVAFAQEARMYSLLTLLAALCIWGMCAILGPARDEGVGELSKPRPFASRSAMAAWPAFVAGSVGALYTHNAAVVLVVTCNLVLAIYYLTGRIEHRPFLKRWSVASALVLLCWTPWLPVMRSQARTILSDYWIPGQDLARLLDTLGILYVPVDRPPGLYIAASLIMLFLWLTGLYRLQKGSRWAAFLLVLPLAPLAAVLLVGIFRPLLLTRPLIWTAVAVYVSVAVGVLAFRQVGLRGLLLGCLTGVHLWGLADYYAAYRKEAWDQAAAVVAGELEAEDIILIHKDYVKEPFDYYFRRHGSPAREVPLHGSISDIEAQMTSLPPHRRFWLVASHVPHDEMMALLKVLVRFGSFQKETPLTGLNVLLFTAR